jgi:hypothetical protein
LKRGTELPFKVVKEYFTVTDYQTKTILNIYRGERPFVRYCEKVGVLVVQNLPKRKAGEVNIKVSFAVDENETLQIEAQHLSRDENGKIIESELYEMHIDRAAESKVMETEGELILESQKFKNDDANTLESVDRINNLIDSIRLTSTKLPNQKEIEDLINQVIDNINKNEDKLNDEGYKNIIEKLLAIELLTSHESEVHLFALKEPTRNYETKISKKVSKDGEAIESSSLSDPNAVNSETKIATANTNSPVAPVLVESLVSSLALITHQTGKADVMTLKETQEGLPTCHDLTVPTNPAFDEPDITDPSNMKASIKNQVAPKIITAQARDETAATFFRF